MLKRVLIFCICLWVCSFAFTQTFPSLPRGGDQKEMLKQLQEENPKLAEFQKRILSLYEEIQIISEDYQQGNLTKEEAEKKLRPLLREQIEISTNPDYLVEMSLFGMLLKPQSGLNIKRNRP